MSHTHSIMAVVNQDYIPHLKTMWASLFESNPFAIDFYVFHEELSASQCEELLQFTSKWQNKNIIFMPQSSQMLEGLPVTKEFPKEIYFKLLGLDQLPSDLSQILCMDLDMIVKKDISPLLNTNVGSHGLAVCHDIFSSYYCFEDNNLKCLGLSDNRPYFNAGLMLFSLDFIRQIGGGKAIIKLAFDLKDKLYYPEQDILNIIFHDSYLELPWQTYNCPPIFYILNPTDVTSGIILPLSLDKLQTGEIPESYMDYTKSICDNASILHYMGGTKPWKKDREQSPVYEIFDVPYREIKNQFSL